MPRPILFCVAVVLSLARVSIADDARIRAEIEAAMDRMSKAVLAADKPAYLAAIDSSDHRLVAEQMHWADELAAHKPVEFSIRIGEGEATFGDSSAEVPIVMKWRFEDGLKDNWGMDPKGREVKFPTVTFIRKDGNWLYQGEKWKEIAGADRTCVVRFFEGSEKTAEDVLKAFPVSKAHVDKEFQNPIADIQTIKIYRSMDHLKATVFLNMPDAVLGGWSEPGESIKFMDWYTRGVPGWTAAFAHEYAHVATWELGRSAAKMPWWVEEGIAECCAAPYRPKYADEVAKDLRSRLDKGTLPAWNDISDYLTADPKLKRLAYTQGFSMVSFITKTWGQERRNKWLVDMAGGASLREATSRILGSTFDELDSKWRDSLKGSDDTAATKAQLEQLLRGMTAMVAAANQEGYLAFVSRSDPVFFKEQQNWAKDLGRAPVESIEMTLDGDVAMQPDGSASAPLVMKWRMPKGKDRSVNFPVRFVKGEVGWLYAGEKWNVLKGEHALVLYEDEKLKDVAAAVAEILPEVRTHVHEGFELSADRSITERVQQVKLYTSMRHLQHSIYLSYTDGLSGWNEPDEAIKILAGSGTGKSMLRVLLAHEYGHVATFHLGPKSTDMPWWVLEGVAELSASKFSRDAKSMDRMVKGWAKADKIIAWPDLADFHGEALKHQQNVYTQGHHMVAFISDTFGRSSRNNWLREMAKGSTIDQATRQALGLSFEELDAKWRATLVEEKKPEPVEAK